MDRAGYIKVYWSDIKKIIKEINAEFFYIVDKIDPDQNYPLFLLTFPYGEQIGDDTNQFIPISNTEFKRLSDPSLPSELQKYLGYGKNSSPMGMIINKQFEWFIDLPQKSITLPVILQNPGDFFSYTKALDVYNKFNYSPMGVLSAVSGARSLIMLPSISCQTKLAKLNRELKIKVKQPTHMYQHFSVFKTILNSEKAQNEWLSSLVYFSQPWIENIQKNPEWVYVKQYFYNLFAKNSIYQKNIPFYQTAYSLILEKTNQKPNPYLFDTLKHLIDTMTGETPGFSPLIDNKKGPINILQEVFTNAYGLSSAPTIMGPNYFGIQDDNFEPIYYSLQFPTTRTFSPNSRKSSMMEAMKDLKDMYTDLFKELIKDNHLCSDTIIQHTSRNVNLSFFHNTEDIDGSINFISELFSTDNRFCFSFSAPNLPPAQDSKFFRGCIKVY